MAHNPKLEVYQVWLKPNGQTDKTFRNFVLDTISQENSEEVENSELFLDFFHHFIEKIDSDEFIANSNKKKAFTAYDTAPTEESEPTITIRTDKNLIEGTIEGGRYGIRRNKSSMENKSEKEGITNSDIILDKFYFCLYTPFDSDLGILFLQSYSTDSISDIFTEFISKLFKSHGTYTKAKIDKFVPRRIINDFKNNSNVKKFSFTSRFVFDHHNEESIGQEEEEFSIKIEAISKNGLSKESLPSWLTSIGSKMFNSQPLSGFSKGKVYLKNTQTNKETPFDIDSDLEIKPVIYLEGRIDISIDGLPNFSQLSQYCINLLDNEIIPEIYISDEVKER